MAIVCEFEPDKEHAKLLIQDCPAGKSFEDAKRIIELSGMRVVKVTVLPSNQIMMLLGSEDMREIVLDLTEHGYIVEGMNALR
jgi:hypothetical protein